MAVDSSQKQNGEVKSLRDDPALQQAVEAVDLAFPDLKCLRCGNDEFFLFHNQAITIKGKYTSIPEDEYVSGSSEIIDLICKKCGLIEKHFLPIMQKAKKPIVAD